MDSQHDNKKWIAVYTKPHHEKTVERKLLEKELEVYLPILKKKKKMEWPKKMDRISII